MEFFKKYRNIILKYSFLLFLMIFTVYLVFQNLDINSIEKIKDIISKIMPVVIDGNTHMYIMLSQNDSIYDVDVSKYVDIIKYSEGMEITLEYTMDSRLNKVVGIIK